MISESCINDKSYIQNHKSLINITDGKCIKNNSLYRPGETFLSKGLLQSNTSVNFYRKIKS